MAESRDDMGPGRRSNDDLTGIGDEDITGRASEGEDEEEDFEDTEELDEEEEEESER